MGIILTTLVVCLFAVPNFFPEAQVKTWPKWAQRHIVLGLDLQGGSHLLFEVDSNAVKKDKLEQVRDDVRRTLRDAKIPYTGLAVRGDNVEVRITNGNDAPTALTKLRELSQPLGGLLGSNGQRSLEVADAGGGLIRLTVPQAALTDRIRQAIEQSITIIEKRVNELGTVEPLIQRQGIDRILVQAPGEQNPQRLIDIVGKTAKMDFRMVDSTVPPDQAATGAVPADSELLPSTEPGRSSYVIKKQVLVSGGDLTDAQPGFDQRSNEPIVSFRFNTSGSRKFAQATTENVGQPFAIVLDGKVISAPVIREPITGGSAEPRAQFRCCPRCGAVLTSPGACPLACAVCGFAYYFNPAVSAAGILLRGDGQGLFIRRGHEPGLGRLAFVGGFVDAGETPEDALRREVREEVGVDLDAISYLGSQPNTYAYRGITYHVVDCIYVAQLAEGAAPRAIDGVEAIEWHDPLALDPARLAFASMTWALAAFQRQRTR